MDQSNPAGRHAQPKAISLRDLGFIRDVLIPRAWVSGDEVDELVRLRDRLDRYFDDLRRPPPAPPDTPPITPAPVPAATPPPAPVAPETSATSAAEAALAP